MKRITGLALHNITLSLFIGEGNCGYKVGPEINTQDGDGAEGQRHVGQNEQQEGRDLRDVGGQGVGDRLLQVVKDQTACVRKWFDIVRI